jgi:hypothetical protein
MAMNQKCSNGGFVNEPLQTIVEGLCTETTIIPDT